MRIGEMLIEQRKLRSPDLTRALEEHIRTGRRVVSVLIAHGAIDFDTGSRALGEQKRCPALLEKHLAGRDHKLAALLPAELGRSAQALPVGRASNGTLIVAARDPSTALHAQIAQATRGQVTLVIAPAARLDELILDAYGPAAEEEFDIDLDSRSNLPPAPKAAPALPPLPDMDALDPESVRLALTDLDDIRVTKDPAASGQFIAQTRAPTLPPAAPKLSTTLEAIDAAATREAATDVAMAFLAGSWKSAVILAIRGGNAIGYRAHGAAIGSVETLVIPLDAQTTVKNAIETKRSSIRLYSSPPQQLLGKRLDSSSLAAAPVVVGSQAVAVIVVGPPMQTLGETERWIGELGRLAQGLGRAYERIAGDRR
jgi:hypothetical protein